MENEFFIDIIKKICDELKIKLDVLSNGWIIMLRKGNITKFISGYKFDLNNHSLGLVLDDKYALYETLKALDLSVVKHEIVYGIDNKNPYAIGYNTLEYLNGLYNKYNGDVVLKTNNGTCGINVYHITSTEELERIYTKIGTKSNSLSLCPYYDIEYEFRCIMLDNELRMIYKKIRPIVIGDGKSTIRELLLKFNYNYFINKDEEGFDRVLDLDEKYMYDWKFNLSRGAIMSEDIAEDDFLKVSNLATKVSKMLDLGFCSVDIIKSKGKYYVLEINSGVMMKNFINLANDGYDKAYKIYRDAVIKMFDR